MDGGDGDGDDDYWFVCLSSCGAEISDTAEERRQKGREEEKSIAITNRRYLRNSCSFLQHINFS